MFACDSDLSAAEIGGQFVEKFGRVGGRLRFLLFLRRRLPFHSLSLFRVADRPKSGSRKKRRQGGEEGGRAGAGG